MKESEWKVSNETHQTGEWRQQAACRGEDTERFFSGRISNVRELCDSCRVAPNCLLFALQTETNSGVFGGMTANKRKRLMGKVATLRAAQRAVDKDRRIKHREPEIIR